MNTLTPSTWSTAARRWLLRTLAILLVPTSILDASAQSSEFVFSEVMEELWLETPDENAITSVWWVPTEYWQPNLQDMSAQEAKEFRDVLDDYTMLIVIDGEIGVFGGTTFTPPSQLRGMVSLQDEAGGRYEPFSEEDIDANALIFISMMRPVFEGMLGPMGENMALLLFPGESPEGRRIADPLAEGQFVVQVGERHFEWQTPLGSFLPPKFCPVDGKRLNGAWKYCPWHGEDLQLTP